MILFVCLAIWWYPGRLFLNCRLWSTSIHRFYRVLYLLHDYLMINCANCVLCRHSGIVYSLRRRTPQIILIPLVCPGRPRLFEHHLLIAVPLQLLLNCDQMFPVNCSTSKHLRVSWMISTAHYQGWINGWIGLVLSRRLRGRSQTHFKVISLSNLLTFGTNQRCSINRRRVLVRNLCRVYSMIVLVMIGTWVSVLVEIHQDILNLRLFWRVHHHHYGRPWLTAWVSGSTWSRLVTDELAAPEIVLCTTSTIVSVESLRGWACPGLFRALFRRGPLIDKGRGASSRSLSLWGSLRIVHLMGGLLIVILGKVCMSCILLMPLISLVTRCWW